MVFRAKNALRGAALMAVCAIGAGCAPYGYGNVGFTYTRWATQDEQLPAPYLLEIETILNRLGYLSSQPDGAIGVDTRDAIRRFQSDIGAPVTGFISPTLLAALRANAGAGVGTVIAAPASSTTGPAPSSGGTSGGGSGGGSGGTGGGTGGGGGGGWQ